MTAIKGKPIRALSISPVASRCNSVEMDCTFSTRETANLKDALNESGLVIAQDWGLGGAKRYHLLLCQAGLPTKDQDEENARKKMTRRHVCKMSLLAKKLLTTDHHMYEVLRSEMPLKLFFDVEWPVDGSEDDADAPDKLKSLLKHVDLYGRGHKMFRAPIVLDSSRPSKRSYHVIYPHAVFRKIDLDLKTFVLGFIRWIVEERRLWELTYLKVTKRGGQQLRCVVDSAVYTKNRCFRMLGQSKASDRMSTKLSLCESSSDVNIQDTLVQCTDQLECVYEEEIGEILKYRAPADGLYPIYPSPSFGYKAIEKGTVCFKLNKVTAKCKVTGQVVVPKTLGKLMVEKDEDILNSIDASELKQCDFTGLFLPILCSMTTAFNDDILMEWMGGKSKTKKENRLTYARKKGAEDRVAVVKCEAALAFLRKKYATVVDMRPDCIRSQPFLQVIKPIETKEWTFVKTGEELKNTLRSMCLGDKRSRFSRKRACFLGGEMAVGKTASVLYFAKERLAEDVYKHITYFGPRTVLVKQVSERMECLKLASSVTRRKHVTVHSYFTGMDDDSIYIHGVRYMQVQSNSNSFHAACINSAAKTPLNPDVVIIDEAVVDVGNMFIHFNQSSLRSRKDGPSENAIKYDRAMIEAVVERIKNASIVIYIDAAFTSQIIEAFSLIWTTFAPFCIEKYSSKEKKAWQSSISRIKKNNPAMSFCTNKTRAQHFQVAPIVRVAVYDPSRDTGIFSQLQEFVSYEHLKTDIMKSIVSKNPCIVYTSSSRTATELFNMVKTKGISPVPMMTLVTAESVKQSKNMAKCISDMDSSVFVVASNLLSCGVSFETPDMFNMAYAIFEFSPYTPPLADMVQLCARVRSVSSKTLRYHVISRGSKHYANKKSMHSLNLRHQELSSCPVSVAFHKLNEAEYMDHVNMCRQRGYAAICLKKALMAAFTHVKNPTQSPFIPKHILVKSLAISSNLPTKQDISRYRAMCKDLPPETTYKLFSGTKRPIMVTRNDLPPQSYCQVAYQLAAVQNKDGSFNPAAVEPIPYKRRKKEDAEL